MLDIKIIAIYLFISSISYRFLLFPKKIMTLRGLQLSIILIYNALIVSNIIPINNVSFYISIFTYALFIFYPQLEAKKILNMIINSNGNNDIEIEKKLKKLFFLTADFKAFNHDNGIIEYFLKTIAETKKELPSEPKNMTPIIKRLVPHITYILMLIIIIMFLITNNSSPIKLQFNLIKYGGNFYSLVLNGEYFRFFSSIFLHANWTHLLMNGFALFYLGIFIERIAITRSFYLSIFIIGGVLASMSSYFLAKQNSVGASGAIFALIGALFSIIWLSKDSIDKDIRKKILRDVLFIIVINIALGLSIKNIDNYAHMGGLISGAVLTYILYKLNNKLLFKIFDGLAIAVIFYGSFHLFNNIKSYPQNITFNKNITISNTSFKIPSSWEKVIKNNNAIYQDLFFSRFIMEGINQKTYKTADYISKKTLENEFNKKINNFENISIKVNKIPVKLVKFEVEFDKKTNDIRFGRIYFLKYQNKYFRFTVIFLKESYEEYGDIMVRFLESNIK